MKKCFILIVLLFFSVGLLFSQNNDSWNWGGLVRFKPMAIVTSLILGGYDIAADWIPYVTPNIGIPIAAGFSYILGDTAYYIMTGIEAVPIGSKEKNGLFLTALAGPYFFNDGFDTDVLFMGKANIGYQFVSKKGFVFTPAAGVKYNKITGIFFDIMLDIGFAYRKR